MDRRRKFHGERDILVVAGLVCVGERGGEEAVGPVSMDATLWLALASASVAG
jgi:hypothetical protein